MLNGKSRPLPTLQKNSSGVEFECEFLGSVDTLISVAKLKTLVYNDPIKKNAGLDIYENPIDNHNYIITVDTARGIDGDYSAFIVFDITDFPYRVVAKYKSNEIKPMLFPASFMILQKHIIGLTH